MFVVVVIKPLHARSEALVHGLAHGFARLLKHSAIAFQIRFRAFNMPAIVMCALLNERNHLRFVASERAFFDTVNSTREFFAAVWRVPSPYQLHFFDLKLRGIPRGDHTWLMTAVGWSRSSI